MAVPVTGEPRATATVYELPEVKNSPFDFGLLDKAMPASSGRSYHPVKALPAWLFDGSNEFRSEMHRARTRACGLRCLADSVARSAWVTISTSFLQSR